MPLRILLITVGLQSDNQIVGQVFEDDWGLKNLFRKMFYLAIEYRDDAAFSSGLWAGC
jgi:hypothetical protein